MSGWLDTIQEWLQNIWDWIAEAIRRFQVQQIMQELEIVRRALQSAQQDMTERAIRLKTTKEINPNDPLVPLLEGDVEEFERQIKRRQTRIEDLERRLNELDPDGSIRASL